jgi:predicted nucleotidyltransferase
MYTPESFTEELKKTFGDSLRSVVLFGSAASGDHHKDYSDFNLLVVLERLDMAACKAAAKPTRAWTKAGSPPPLIFTDEELRRSGDVFPIELLDMQDHRRVLYGEDPLAHFKPNSQNLRLELERDLRSNLLKLRQACLAVLDDPKKTRELTIRAGSTFLVLFRGALRFLKVSPLPPKPDLARALSQRVSFDPAVFAHIERLKAKDKAALEGSPGLWMERLLEAVSKVTEAVDSWKQKE